MKKFKDLKFEESIFGGVGVAYTFKNGITISVQGSSRNYCTPKEDLMSAEEYLSFEVALWNVDGEWVTTKYIDESLYDVLGWQDRDEITAIMLNLQKTKK